MSEEEKKAIEILKIEGTENNYLEVKIVLKLIDKLQKENEELSQSNFRFLEINQKLIEEKPIIKELTENNLSYQEELAKTWKENKELKEEILNFIPRSMHEVEFKTKLIRIIGETKDEK